ncbi:alpha/beta hydrolase family protein [Corynebacterium stationis]|uniref:alpha/beta hydrolase family protein n=2 Tax=Corynebacterium stationis TaxID=1705 RepID=UPI00263B72D4|nr:alpha/beta hydrolase family protein [Corynebacterium stationis]
MPEKAAHVILVPGAWMGGWIWEPTVNRLRSRGIDAETMTLRGLEPGQLDADIARVSLDDHVQQLVEHIAQTRADKVILVSHSYSGVVVASAADRLGTHVAGIIHIGAFLPVAAHALLDNWGSSEDERAQEKADIEAAGNLWLSPTREMLDYVDDLTDADRDYLTSKFTAHPGRTVLDAAHLSSPVEEQPTTYVALSLKDAPAVAKSATTWQRRSLVSGHWPMVSAFDETVTLIEEEIRRYSRDA